MKKGLLITGIILIVLVGFGFYVYNSIISPSVEKPQIERPVMPVSSGTTSLEGNEQIVGVGSEVDEQEAEIEEEHIQYLVNEIGAYNLHEDPLSDDPAIMQFDVTDAQRSYTITIIDNFPEVVEGEAENPDLILHAKQTVLIDLLQADNFEQRTVELMETGEMWMEILADEQTLALKGYKAIYDQVTSSSDDMVTGNVIAELNWP